MLLHDCCVIAATAANSQQLSLFSLAAPCRHLPPQSESLITNNVLLLALADHEHRPFTDRLVSRRRFVRLHRADAKVFLVTRS
jgi:hypothetical protein